MIFTHHAVVLIANRRLFAGGTHLDIHRMPGVNYAPEASQPCKWIPTREDDPSIVRTSHSPVLDRISRRTVDVVFAAPKAPRRFNTISHCLDSYRSALTQTLCPLEQTGMISAACSMGMQGAEWPSLRPAARRRDFCKGLSCRIREKISIIDHSIRYIYISYMVHMETGAETWMGIVKIGDEIHEEVRRASIAMCRSINQQAEFWMKIGMLAQANPTSSFNDIVKAQLAEADVRIFKAAVA